MFEFPDDVRRVNLIFKFMNRRDLAPTETPRSDHLPVTMQQPGGRNMERLPRKPGTASRSYSRTRLNELPDMLRNQDFALISERHGKSTRPDGDVEYGAKFLFAREEETSHRGEARRLADLEGLLRNTSWRVYARVFKDRPDMLVITCSSPRDAA